MTQSMGTLDFFLIEAGEYLERLDALAQAPAGTPPAIDEFVRLSRAFRGSAIMASQHGMGRAAQGLEACARAMREGRLQWTDMSRGEIIRAVDDCKILMRRLRAPDQGDTERAEAIGARLDKLSGRASGAMRASQPGLDAGGRAFVAREASSIASVLQQVAKALRASPNAREALAGVPPAMSALRGVAMINDLPPLGEMLAAVESAAKSGESADVFDDAAKALARAAREVVDGGRPELNSGEAQAFAARLFGTLGNVVAVESLFFDDAGPHVVQQGSPPAGAAQSYGRVEMVSQGEYLNAAGTELAKAEGVQRDLRLYTIAASLRPMIPASGSPMAAGLGQLAAAACDAVGRGAASARSGEFVRHLREAADILASAQSGDEERLGERLAVAAGGLNALKVEGAPPRPSLQGASGAQAAQPVAPAVEGRLPLRRPSIPVPVTSVVGESDLATAYMTLEQLITDRGLPMGSLAELLGGQPAAMSAPVDQRPIVPVESLAPAEDGVPVETLLYRGDAALRRIMELKPEIAAESNSPGPRLQALIHEMLDLVELSLQR